MSRWASSLVCLMLLLVGCTAPPGTPSPSSTRVWDPMSWRPSETIALPQMSPEEMAQWRIKELKGIASSLGVTPTSTPALVYWTLPDEQPIPVSKCLRDRGWDATAGPDGGTLVSGVQDAQKSAMKLDQYECIAQFSVDPRYMTPTPQMLGAVWEYFESYGIPCMAHFGFTPDEALPSRETFISTNGAWFLYPTKVSVHIPDDVTRACPQLPPTRAVFSQ